METINPRTTDYPINPAFPQRWSPRAMSGEELREEEIFSLFEAARWAPSSYNNQPWRFLYARRNTPAWDQFFDLLVEPNKIWCKNAAVLVVIISKTTFDHNGKPSKTHSYDAGAAWGYLALQGSMNNLVIHGMQGFDYQKAKETLEIPDDYQVEAMAAIGKPGKKDDLPEEVRKREFPSDRKKITEIAFEGKFGK
jgi:nitroreductase